jgi:hypothetical protein
MLAIETTITKINAYHQNAKWHRNVAVESPFEAGKLQLEVKATLLLSKFTKWIRGYLNASEVQPLNWGQG